MLSGLCIRGLSRKEDQFGYVFNLIADIYLYLIMKVISYCFFSQKEMIWVGNLSSLVIFGINWVKDCCILVLLPFYVFL